LCSLWAVPACTEDRIKDADINYWVQEALRNDPHVNSTTIQVLTEKGIVKLMGTTRDLASKQFASQEAKKIRGVVGVLNEVHVQPPFRSDYNIENDVRRRLLDSPVIESQDIRVECVEGRVTIAGEVPSLAEKQEAELLAGEVLGVKEVKDQVLVDYKTSRSDQEIKSDVVTALNLDVYLHDYPIEVSVDDHVVTLKGSVGSAFEKSRAYDKVRWISNVKDVKNLLIVEWWRDHGTQKKIPSFTSDELRDHVCSILSEDQRVNSNDIMTEVHDGNVTLRGTVPNLVEKEIAEKDARNVIGVAWVTNYLLPKDQFREDWAISDDIKSHIKTDGALFNSNILVAVSDGIATLSGDVHAWWQWSHARDIALHILGVKEVVNNIKVDWNSLFSDPSIRKAIENRLEWNWKTVKISNRIIVNVRNGVAELTGSTDTWSQRKEAGLVAANTMGVWLVDNRLSVKGISYPWSEWYYHGVYHSMPPPEYSAISKSW